MELGDVVAVETNDGRIAYFGEVTSLPTGDDALFDRGVIGVWNPETDEVHKIPSASSALREATEAESDAYIARWAE